MGSLRTILALSLLVSAAACGGSPAPTVSARAEAREPSTIAAPSPAAEGFAATSSKGAAHWSSLVAPGDLIPVTDQDPLWGDPDAPVTIVAFEDLECPYCADSAETLASLMHRYGPHKLRIAFKNDPLPMHEGARGAADLGAAIFQLGGSEAFFAYANTVFREVREDRQPSFGRMMMDGVSTALSVVPISTDDLKGAVGTSGANKVNADLALAKALDTRGTPAFYVNGVAVHGAESEDVFARIIDDELSKIPEKAERGSRGDVYASRLSANVSLGRASAAPERTKKPEPPDTVLHLVPIDGSPSRGKPTALVTIVEFSDFECPACQASVPTLKDLATKYGDKVRFVFKEMPLSSHSRAEPAAELATAIYKKKGNGAFWKAYDALFDASAKLDDANLQDVATAAGLDGKTALAESAARKYRTDIAADEDLADDLGIDSLPQFFINGKRIRGNQPADAFQTVIDSELASAEALLKGGTKPAGVYDAIMKSAVGPAAIPTKHAPAVTRGTPNRGPAGAPVTIQVFGDFQCPFCKKLQPTLADLEKDFPGKVRFVFREMPLSMHADAMPAAKAAVEAHRQKGDAGFWAFHDAIYAVQGTVPDALKRPQLEKIALDQGLDLKAFGTALDAPDPPQEIEDDLKIAKDLDVRSTPTTLVNDFVITGSQPLRKFEKLVRRALAGKR